ncbi:hypothetical protein BC628DRAFT_919328 [Trametes gibbosa]|nr:hypothetical protein BC628DRAFT_919328 [Trametes gibbosa]
MVWPIPPPPGTRRRRGVTGTRVVCPGECFLRSSGVFLVGMQYEKQVKERTLIVENFPAVMVPVPIPPAPEENEQSDTNGRAGLGESSSRGDGRRRQARRKKDERRPRQVEAVEVVYKVKAEDLIFNHSLQACEGSERWRRYTVHGMAHDWTLRTSTRVKGGDDCAEWLLMLAPALCDLPLDLHDLAMATALRFTTCTYVIEAFDKRSGRGLPPHAPPTLYFYERVHDYPRATLGMDGRLDWPWAFWSTEDDDRCDVYRAADVHRAGRKHSIAYAGVTQAGTFRWIQIICDYIMHIDVRVEVDYCQFTQNECLVLDEIQDASIAEDEWQSDPWRMEVDEEEEDDGPLTESIWEVEEMSMDDGRGEDDRYESEDSDEEGWYDDGEIAQDLYWLREQDEYPMYELKLRKPRAGGTNMANRHRVSAEEVTASVVRFNALAAAH